MAWIEGRDRLLRAHPDQVQLVAAADATMKLRQIADAWHAIEHALIATVPGEQLLVGEHMVLRRSAAAELFAVDADPANAVASRTARAEHSE